MRSSDVRALGRLLLIVGVIAVYGAVVNSAGAVLYISDDFSTYSNGNLVGQNGWTQFTTSGTLPIQVTSGQAVIPGANRPSAVQPLTIRTPGRISAR